MSTTAAPAPAAAHEDPEDQMAAALAEMRQERASEGAAPSPAPSPADAPAPAPAAAATPALDATNDTGAAPAPAPAAPTPPAAKDTPEEALRKTQEELQRARSEVGRVGALNRTLSESRGEVLRLRDEIANLKKAAPPAPTAGDTAAKALEILKAKATEYPEMKEFADAVAAALEATTASAKETVTKGMAPVIDLQAERAQQQQAASAAAYETDLATFQGTYPNAKEILRGQDFNAWLPSAPKQVQDAFRNGQTPGEALAVMDAYDAHLRRTGKEPVAQYQTQQPQTPAPAPAAAAPKPSNTARLAAAAGLPSRASGAKGGLPPEDDFDASLEHFRRQRLDKAARAA